MLLLQPDPAMLGRKGTRTTAWRGCEASCWGGGEGAGMQKLLELPC